MWIRRSLNEGNVSEWSKNNASHRGSSSFAEEGFLQLRWRRVPPQLSQWPMKWGESSWWNEGWVRRLWTNSWAIKILSDISLSETNADCVGDTREGRIGLSLATMIFDMILYMTEQRLMGRISVINRGLSFLGIKQIWVKFQSTGKDPVRKNASPPGSSY